VSCVLSKCVPVLEAKDPSEAVGIGLEGPSKRDHPSTMVPLISVESPDGPALD